MKIPDSIFIRGQKWRIRVRKNLFKRDTCYGLTSCEDRLIELDDSLRGLDIRRVLIHELIHAVLWESGATSHTTVIDPFLEEIICDAIAESFTQDMALVFRKVK
jgi:hypothetical protein